MKIVPDESRIEEIAARAVKIYHKHITFEEFKAALDVRFYNTPTLIYQIIFITVAECKSPKVTGSTIVQNRNCECDG